MPVRKGDGTELAFKGVSEVRKGDGTVLWQENTNAIPDSGLQHDWPIDEGSGSTVFDQAGSNDGTISGATWTTTAKTGGQALSFDGTDDYVDGITGLTQYSAASLIAWIRPSEVGSGPYCPVMRGDASESGSIDFGISLVDNTSDGSYDDIRFLWRDTNGFQDIYADGQAAADTWLMVAHTVDATNGFDGYINDANNVASTTSADVSYAGNDVLNFGRRPINERYFAGVIDNVLYYDRKLSASEVSEIYNKTV